MIKHTIKFNAPTYDFVSGECEAELPENHTPWDVANAIAEHLTESGYFTDVPTIESAIDVGYGSAEITP